MSDEPAVIPAPTGVPEAARRLDVHNAEIDDELASRHRCGMVQLATGDACVLPERHSGGCDFRPRSTARDLSG